MPKSNNNNTIARQWEMLKMIPKKAPGITATELVSKLSYAGIDVSKRTVERDLRDLSMIFPIAATDSVPPFGWYWIRDIGCEFGGVEVSEAVSLTLAEDILKSVLPVSMLKTLEPRFESARKKLAALDSLPISKWSSKVRYIPDSLPTTQPFVKNSILETLQTALVGGRQIKVAYDPMWKKTKTYMLNPLAIVQRGARGYLIAVIDGYENPVQFEIQRLRSVEILKTSAIRPKGFSLDKYIESGVMQFGQGEVVKLKANVSETLAMYLDECEIAKDQKLRFVDGKWQLSATIKNSWQLMFWIRSQGSDITVLSPKSIREDLLNDAKKVVENYG